MPLQPRASDWVDGSGNRYPADVPDSEASRPSPRSIHDPDRRSGLLIGLLLGLLGGGGSILAVPALVYGASMPLSAAIPTSLIVVGSRPRSPYSPA